MNWISVKDHLPTEEKAYLVTEKCFGRIIGVVNWSNDLYKLNKYTFADMKEKSGFWMSDSEWGYCLVDDVLAWCEVEVYEGE